MNTLTHALRASAAAALLACGLAAHGPALAAFGDNLIVNAGAEAAVGGDGSFVSNLPGWTVSGELTAIGYELGCPGGYPCVGSDPLPANPGANHFGGGYAASSVGTQTISLGFAGGAINGAGAHFALSGWLGGYASQNDSAAMALSFRDAAGQVIGSSTLGPVLAADRGNVTAMVLREASGWVPAGAVSADVSLTMARAGGSSNDGYADNLSFSLTEANTTLAAPGSARVGETFSVTVAVNQPFGGAWSGDELLAFGFDLGYDHSLLRLNGVAVADGWNDDSALVSGVDVAASTFPGVADAGQGSVQLATLSFEVLAAGAALIDLQSSHGSNLNEGLTYALGDSVDLYGRVAVTLQPVPEPASGLLLSLGGLVLAGLARAGRLQRRA